MSKSLKRAERIVCSLVLMLSVFVTTVFATALYLPVSSLEEAFAADNAAAENVVTPAKPTYTFAGASETRFPSLSTSLSFITASFKLSSTSYSTV